MSQELAGLDKIPARPDSQPLIMPAARLITFSENILRACGLRAGNAAEVARLIVEADLTNASAHGVFRLPEYTTALQNGLINARAVVRTEQSGVSTALVNGDNGMGHLGGAAAARTAIVLARGSGVGWVGVHKSNHAGAGAIYAAIPASAGMIGIYASVAAANHMAPWGSGAPLLGTNPLAIAVPAGNGAVFVIDMATSVASFGAIKKLAQSGQPIPEGWMIDRQTGEALTDAAAIDQGALAPLGGHKGSGLSMALGLLAGVLNGAAFGSDIRSFELPASKPADVGQLVIAVDPSRFMPAAIFEAAVARHLEQISASKPLPGVDQVRWPGERRSKLRAERLASGIPLEPALVERLTALAEHLGTQPL